MIGARARTSFDGASVRRASQAGTFQSLGHAGAAIRLTARRSIRRGPSASMEGTPPHTRRGLLKRAIVYAVEKAPGRVVIGPTYEIAGPSGMAHEFGGRYRGQRYPKRAFMGPALLKLKDRLPRFWAGSVR